MDTLSPSQANGDLPVDQLAELPPVRALLEGNPAALYADEGQPTPLALTIGKNFKKIGQLGLGLYRSPNKKLVLFNPGVLHPADLKAADQAGKLDSVAQPLASFDAPEAQTAPVPAQSSPTPVSGSPAPGADGLAPRAQSKLAGQRIKALQDVEEPSKRRVPGGGTILNSLMSRAV